MLSKVLERVVHDQIFHYVTINNIVSTAQHAYRPNHSTTTALVKMTDDWLSAMDKGELVGVVYIDFSAAFDLVDHCILLAKLKSYGFQPGVLAWFESYLQSRTQVVYINGQFSEPLGLECGVPQGSCLGPLLFTLYTMTFR